MRTFDVLVVGGGTAGCVLAARLSEEATRSVCLVEAGPDYGPFGSGRWPADILDARSLALTHAWETDREDRSQLRARLLGGCSAHNACVVLEGAPADYDWGLGWSHESLAPFLERAREALAVRVFQPHELSPWHAAWAESAGEAAIVHPVNAAGTVRWNAAFAYVDAARERPGLTILADTLVDRVLLEDGRAVGVVTSAGELRADVVVLTAGAYGSPGILLRSGIGPEQGLAVGEGLTDHVGIGIGWQPTEALSAEADAFAAERPVFMAQVTVGATAAGGAHGRWDLYLFPALEPGWEISAAAFAMKPWSRGRVRLNDRDPRTPLAIDHGLLADERDVALLTEGVERLREFAAEPPIRRYVASEIRPGASVGPLEHVRAAVRGFFHPTGTCAIGVVVDERCRVRGIENLVVADASVIPSIPRANTNLTVAAVAERLATTI
jgi:choline dehydrogenase